MELSERLQAAVNMVTQKNRAADIGCDHGYVSIYLVENHISPYVIAIDINKGPIERAQTHIHEHGLSEYIETRLSDGMKALKPGEVDTIICAGMGGRLMIKILEEGKTLLSDVKELILQPQSDIALLRKYLKEHAYCICAEDIVLEDGKYYPMMKAVHGQETEENLLYDRYGRLLLTSRHPVLLSYLKKENEKLLDTIVLLKETEYTSEKSKQRMIELEEEFFCNKEALSYFFHKLE